MHEKVWVEIQCGGSETCLVGAVGAPGTQGALATKHISNPDVAPR